jgi:excisionase family DNA binding protein
MHTLAAVARPISPTDQEARIAQDSVQPLAAMLRNDQGDASVHMRVRTYGDADTDVALPRAAMLLVLSALQELAKGKSIALLSVDDELTTQQAADILRVSRPFLIKLLEEGRMPCRRVGAHRRIPARDVLRYMAEDRTRREQVMEKLVEETERLGL